MAVFRVERNTGYTVMSNHHLRNKELSLKAKATLTHILTRQEYCGDVVNFKTTKHFRDNGNCILLDDGDTCVCPQLISYSLLCKWFRIAVLPLDKLLYAELYQTEDWKKCTVCGASFASKSNSVKYCPDCRKRITRRQAAERMP